MRWFKAGLLFALPVCAFLFLSAGCGPTPGVSDEDEYKPPRRRASGPAVVKEEQLKPVAAKDNKYADITGTVTYEGSPLNLVAESANFVKGMGGDAYCTQGKKPDGSIFPLLPIEQQQQEVRLGKDNRLGNVFVWIEPPAGSYFVVPDEQLQAFAGSKVTISQPHCVFLPHCSVVFPRYYKDGKYVPSGQQLVVENDAFVGHNAKFAGRLNQQNETIPAQSGGKPFVLVPEPDPITISCNVHGWMRGYILARDHPYAAVSSTGEEYQKKPGAKPGSDDDSFGRFTLKGAPVGAKVRLRAWHEKLRILDKKTGRELKAGMEVEITPEMKLELVAK